MRTLVLSAGETKTVQNVIVDMQQIV